jgi:GNAT superfamily N-acetyltransferase
MTAEDIEPATHMRLQSWLDTYVNDEVGVTREWIGARNRAQLVPEKITARKKRFNNPDSCGWVAKDETGVIIGVTNPYRDGVGIQHVGSLYVDKAWHGKGVGGALMQKVIGWFDPTRPIELGVVAYNRRAKAFYEKWGFREVPDSNELFDNKIPEVKMIRKGDKQ